MYTSIPAGGGRASRIIVRTDQRVLPDCGRGMRGLHASRAARFGNGSVQRYTEFRMEKPESGIAQVRLISRANFHVVLQQFTKLVGIVGQRTERNCEVRTCK